MSPDVHSDKQHSTIKDAVRMDFANHNRGIFPAEMMERSQWMGHREKIPFAQWADPHAKIPCSKEEHDWTPECGCDPRYKWGFAGNWRDGYTVQMGTENNPEIHGMAYIQTPSDPFIHVDYDDAVDPDTGEVHPAALAIATHLGRTFTEVSTSGTGFHQVFRGELPESVKQAGWLLDDEPWGDNDDPPSVEIYDGKRVNVCTGKHVAGAPTITTEIGDEMLDVLLDANGQYPTEPKGERLDLSGYEPGATRNDEITNDIRDVYTAVDSLDAQDVAEKTIVHKWNDNVSTGEGWRAFYPIWGPNSNGSANIVGREVWQDTGHGNAWGGPTAMAAIAIGEVAPANLNPQDISGRIWWKAVEHLRELGFDIPEYDEDYGKYDTDENVAHTAVIPKTGSMNRLAQGWDWKSGPKDESDALWETRQLTKDRIKYHIESCRNALIHALPSAGKTTGSVIAAHESGVPVTILSPRGREEQYGKIRDDCDDRGLTSITLPSFTEDCPCANGECGETVRDQVTRLYAREITPQEIHANYERWFGAKMPCQIDHACPYSAKWEFDPDDYDVIIGHYNHAHVPKSTISRAVLIDEFPSAYANHYDDIPEAAITAYLKNTDAMPYENYADLMARRGGGNPTDDGDRSDALLHFTDGVKRDPQTAFENEHGLANAPLLVYTLLAGPGNELGNDCEHTRFPDDKRIGVYYSDTNEITIVNPPNWGYARNVIGLDGTPTVGMWRDALGLYLREDHVLTLDERQEYITDGLNMHIVRTTEAIKPYSSGNWVNPDEDGTLIEWVANELGEPGLITSRSALAAYDDAGILEFDEETNEVVDGPVSDAGYYGNLLGSNKFSDTRVGCLIGSSNYGDEFVRRWAAIHGEVAEPNRDLENCTGMGDDLSYGEYGDRILQHMREHQTLQALMRFGRDGRGAVIFVHTNTLPEWVPHAEGAVVKTWSPHQHEVIKAIVDFDDEFTTRDIDEHTSCTRRHTFSILQDFCGRGLLRGEKAGNGYVWSDDGTLAEMGEGGTVEEVDIEDLSPMEWSEVSRNSSFIWDLRKTPTDAGSTSIAEFSIGDRPKQKATPSWVGDGPPPDE